MRKTSVIIALLCFTAMVILAVVVFVPPRGEAQRNASIRYEYAVINGSYSPYPSDGPSTISSAVNVCYLQSQGCQNEEVRAELNLSRFLQDERLENAGNSRTLAVSRATNMAFARAVSKLGSEGWEMISAPDIEFDLYYTNPQGIQTAKVGRQSDRRHIWFKRERQ